MIYRTNGPAKRETELDAITDVLTGSVISERDSRKDEAVVFIFIFATGGLLAWAACKPWIERYVEVGQCQLWTEYICGKLTNLI